jgi:hypothetical protein
LLRGHLGVRFQISGSKQRGESAGKGRVSESVA